MIAEGQILELNATVRCVLKPSQVHGIGVFALKNTKKGERLYCCHRAGDIKQVFTLRFKDLERIDPEIREIIMGRWATVVLDKPFLSPNYDQLLRSFMNHAEYGVANYHALSDQALRDVKAGEEILEDYTLMPQWEKAHPWLV